MRRAEARAAAPDDPIDLPDVSGCPRLLTTKSGTVYSGKMMNTCRARTRKSEDSSKSRGDLMRTDGREQGKISKPRSTVGEV